MDNLIKEWERLGDLSAAFSVLDIALVLCLGFGLSLLIAAVYRGTHKGASYSQAYVHTLVIMGTTVALIMLIIGSNIARAFALVGALSIIRFRNAMKETRDVGFVFLVMAIGMAVGTRFYLLAIFSAVVISAMILLLHRFDMFKKIVRERILRIQLPVDKDHEKVVEEVFPEFLDQHRLLSLETVRAGVLQEAAYMVVLKKKIHPKDLLQALRRRNDNHKVSLILGQREIDI
ncbi:MAG TPA: DUF4956 domain-containing protein [Myxococcota bacterium]|nr:DUF4956 domain-containing protein [Myxococcota bacterium]